MAMITCPLCGSAALAPFFTLENAPLLQNVFFASAEEAVGAPRGRYTYLHCRACDFAFNPAFEAASVSYDQRYDNDQTASPRYRAHVAEVVEHLTTACALDEGSRVLEIGCGNGYFLAELAARTKAHVRGYDPAYDGRFLDEQRILRTTADAARLAADPAGPFELVVLRHCLEPFLDPDAVLAAAAAALCPDGFLFVESASFQTLARSGDFSLIFHEYPRYHSLTSLTIALARHRLSLASARSFFDEQYYGCLFRPQARLDAFEVDGARVRAALARHRKVVLWGASGRAVTFLTHLGLGMDVVAHAVDIAPQKQGRHLPVTGQRVLSPAEANAYGPELVIVANRNYEAEIRAALAVPCAFTSIAELLAEGRARRRTS